MTDKQINLNTQRLRDMIEEKKRATKQQEPVVSFADMIQQEPTMANPQWIDAELAMLAKQWGGAERFGVHEVSKPRYWRGPSSVSDPKVSVMPSGATSGAAVSLLAPSAMPPPPQYSAATASSTNSYYAKPPVQGGPVIKPNLYSRCPFGTFYEDADRIRLN